jgi:hypothetical protein
MASASSAHEGGSHLLHVACNLFDGMELVLIHQVLSVSTTLRMALALSEMT